MISNFNMYNRIRPFRSKFNRRIIVETVLAQIRNRRNSKELVSICGGKMNYQRTTDDCAYFSPATCVSYSSRKRLNEKSASPSSPPVWRVGDGRPQPKRKRVMNNSAILHFLKHAAPPSGSVREVGRKAADVQIGGEASPPSFSLSLSRLTN